MPSRNKFQSELIDGVEILCQVQLIVVGTFCGGKTNIIQRLISKPFDERTLATIGLEANQFIHYRNKKKLDLNIWDMPGQERFLLLKMRQFLGSSVVIIVYDITDRESFDQITSWNEHTMKSIQDLVSLFIVGNKLDLNSERKVPKEEAEAFARKHEAVHLEVSAKTGESINELREKIVSVIWEKCGPPTLPSQQRSLPKKSSFWDFFG